VTVDKAEKLNQHVGQRSAMKLVEIKQGVQIVVVGSCGSQLVAARDQGKKLPFCNEEDDLTHTYRNCFRLGTLTFCTSSSCDQYEYIQYACPICDPEREAEMVAHFLSQSGLQPNEYQWTLDHLAQFDGKMRAVAAAKQLVAVATNLAGWVFLYGNYGVGKSELMKATVAALCRAGIPAIYRRADDILSEAKAIFTNDQEVQDASERAIKTRNGRYQILAIDEVDCISSTA
jgi:DNA replication protein DnaC